MYSSEVVYDTYRADVHFFGAGGAKFACIVGVVEHEAGLLVSLFSGQRNNIGTHDGSMSPLRVAPGSPARGVSPILCVNRCQYDRSSTIRL